MPGHLLGETFALLAALTWACGLVLFKRSGERVPPLALNFFKCAVATVLLAVTLLVVEREFDTLGDFSPGDIPILLLSGFIGIALADTVFFHALNLIGVGLISIVDCLYSPMVIMFAWLLLLEELAASQYLGAGLILAGVFISSRHAPPPDRTRGQLLGGMILGAIAVSLMGLGIVIAKPVLEGSPVLWTTMLRLLMGTVVLGLVMLTSAGRRAELWSVIRPSAVWKLSLPAAFLGTYLAMIFWIGGFTYAGASIAGILNQTSTIFAIILAAVFLKERLTPRKLIAVSLALGGVLIVKFPPF